MPEVSRGKDLAIEVLKLNDLKDSMARIKPPYTESDLSVVEILIAFAMIEFLLWGLFSDNQSSELCFFVNTLDRSSLWINFQFG